MKMKKTVHAVYIAYLAALHPVLSDQTVLTCTAPRAQHSGCAYLRCTPRSVIRLDLPELYPTLKAASEGVGLLPSSQGSRHLAIR